MLILSLCWKTMMTTLRTMHSLVHNGWQACFSGANWAPLWWKDERAEKEKKWKDLWHPSLTRRPLMILSAVRRKKGWLQSFCWDKAGAYLPFNYWLEMQSNTVILKRFNSTTSTKLKYWQLRWKIIVGYDVKMIRKRSCIANKALRKSCLCYE